MVPLLDEVITQGTVIPHFEGRSCDVLTCGLFFFFFHFMRAVMFWKVNPFLTSEALLHRATLSTQNFLTYPLNVLRIRQCSTRYFSHN